MRYNQEQLNSRLEKMKPDLLKKQKKQKEFEKDKIWKRIDNKTIILVK